MKLGGISARIAVASLVVVVVTLAILAIGVMQVGADAFASLMVAAGESADHAHQMFDQSITIVFGVAAVVAAIVALVLAAFLARRIARPIERLAATAEQTALGERASHVPIEGPSEVRALADAYNVMLDRLAEQEQVRREFVVNASHELRTPLTNLRGYLEALRDGVIPPDRDTFISLGEEVERLSRLAASLDVLAGADVERATPAEIDLAAAVRSAVDLAAPGFARHDITVTTDLAPNVTVRARMDEISQVLANLLQNAMRYTPAGGSVAVQMILPAEADEATVRVTNTGSDIPAQELTRVWERFYRVEKSRDRSTGGAGIGLAIVKRLIEDAGGGVGASSEAGRTTFWFSLPRSA